jgi:hypothetical protein
MKKLFGCLGPCRPLVFRKANDFNNRSSNFKLVRFLRRLISVTLMSALLVAEISWAQGQIPYTSDANNFHDDTSKGTSNPSREPPRSDSRSSDSHTGPIKANVDGCVGPVSYCSIYFGS